MAKLARPSFLGRIVTDVLAAALLGMAVYGTAVALGVTDRVAVVSLAVFSFIITVAVAVFLAGRGQTIFSKYFLNYFRRLAAEEILSSTGLDRSYRNFEEASADILAQMSTSKRQYIFVQLGRSVFETSSKLNELIFNSIRPPDADLRVLHASRDSRYLSRAAALKRSDGGIETSYASWQQDLAYLYSKASDAVRKSGQVRQHREPYLWRLFIFDECCFVQPYLFSSKNSQKAPVRLYKRYTDGGESERDNSDYKVFVEYFDAVWDENTPRDFSLRQIEEIDRVVVAALISGDGKTAWGIPHRYFEKPGDFIHFNGVGGKANRGESIAATLERELNEEIGVSFRVLDSDRTIFYSEYLKVNSVRFDGAPRPIVINRFMRSENQSGELSEYYLVAYNCEVSALSDLKPKGELGAVLVLSSALLKRSLEEDLTIGDVLDATDGSHIDTHLSLNGLEHRKLLPSGLALVIASSASELLDIRPTKRAS